MNATQFIPICRRLASIISFDYKSESLKDQFNNDTNYEDNVVAFLQDLSSKAQKIDLALIRHQVTVSDFQQLVAEANYPIFSFYEEQGKLTPVIFYKPDRKSLSAYAYFDNEEVLLEDPEDALPFIHINAEGLVEYVAPIPLDSLVSSDKDLEKSKGPVQRLMALLGAEKKDILYIYFYAIIISIISLVLPVGVQAVIEMVAGGVVFDSIALLITIIIVATLVTGGLQIMQISLVEIIQRRIFVKAALEYTYRLPRMKVESILGEYAPELMNRFFDILNIQKGLPKLLIDLSAAVLQIIFGLVLLSFYHPLFIVFGLILVSVLIALFYYTGPKGLRASLIESKYKYKVVHWLEEIARTLYSFKLAGSAGLSVEKTDTYTSNYLRYRKKLFKVLIGQYSYIVVFKTLVTGGLLTIGTFLVINREINLGQFVASEIVIVLVLGAVEKLILNIDVVYQSLTAVEKIGYVTDIPLERKGGIHMHKETEGMDIKIKDLSYSYPNASRKVLQNINLEIKGKETVCITGYNNSGKATLINIISGLMENYDGLVSFNKISLRDINLNSLRDTIARNVSEDELFDGTILENITMGKAKVKYQDVIWALESVNLLDFVNMQKDGLQTMITSGGQSYSSSIASKLILARCIAERPKLLILNKSFSKINKPERLQLISFLMNKENPWTLLCISNDPLMLSACDRVVLMDNGQIACEGSYEQMIKNDKFRDCMIDPDSII
ncbi:peptidase domain-containing ABC transporter [Sediminitomix flava]|uniref:ABC-type bacteriocin/lantibiotic exporter with double-glycine peptidase domain n=1 Tax=Sediminitomix flava TaxID=379075 RepID=A0A315Z0N3_SEDFL|nr:ABC transporter ATP-binding protein [Sediminitomix flava]PWJ36071.1 ABC-type bacteriocin/lantibiotic exporter with double-glycine peptidase domain [Sediminitomix flava]